LRMAFMCWENSQRKDEILWNSTHENFSQVHETSRLRLSEYARSQEKGQAAFASILPALLPLGHTGAAPGAIRGNGYFRDTLNARIG
jgi:hypothetical protein